MQPAFDIQNITKRVDSLDAKGPWSRGHQTTWAMLQAINSFLYEIQSPGAGHFYLSEDWTEAERTAFETNISNLQTAVSAAYLAAKELVKA